VRTRPEEAQEGVKVGKCGDREDDQEGASIEVGAEERSGDKRGKADVYDCGGHGGSKRFRVNRGFSCFAAPQTATTKISNLYQSIRLPRCSLFPHPQELENRLHRNWGIVP